MKCENFLLLVDAYMDDELELQGSLEISEHLAVCKSCAFSYQKIRFEQEMFERYFLEAEATPALWKNLQSAIRNEKIVQPVSTTAHLGRKLEKVFSYIFFEFSFRKIAFTGLGIFVLCIFVFLIVERKSVSVEDAETNGNSLTVSPIDEQFESRSSISGNNQKEDVQINQAPAAPQVATIQKRLGKQTRRQFKQEKVLPRKNSEIVSSRTNRENNLLPNEQNYLDTIAKLTAEVKSVETSMPPVLRVEYKRNLSTVDQAITETRSAARRYPQNPDLANFMLSAYRGKIALLTDVAKKSKSSTPN